MCVTTRLMAAPMYTCRSNEKPSLQRFALKGLIATGNSLPQASSRQPFRSPILLLESFMICRQFTVVALIVLSQLLLSSQGLFAQEPSSAAEKKDPAVLKQIQGMWTITKGVNQGQAMSEEELKGMHVLVKRYMVITYDRADQERYRATFKIDSSEKPV